MMLGWQQIEVMVEVVALLMALQLPWAGPCRSLGLMMPARIHLIYVY